MAPAQPKTWTAGSNPVNKFEGAFVVTKHTPPTGRNIHFHVVIDPNHPRTLQISASGKKPPTHFHPHQWEFFKVERGSLTVEINGIPHVFTKESGEYSLPPGPHHCLYATPGQPAGTMVELWLGASPSGVDSQLDQAFFENWYGYQEDFLSPPAWFPFRRTFGWLLGVVVGRWIGGLLGYAPFYPEWTTDWDAACSQMETRWTQRRFADRSLQAKKRAEVLARGESVGNEALYKTEPGLRWGGRQENGAGNGKKEV